LRRLSLLAGLALIALAFVAATRIENTRQGLIAEVTLYLCGALGLVLLFYGLFARSRPSTSNQSESVEARTPQAKVPTANDLVLGTTGILFAIILLSGLAFSAGMLWLVLGFVLLLPMIAGSFYLSLRFIRAPIRDWRVDLRAFSRAASQQKHSNHDQSDRPDDIPMDKSKVVGEKEDAKDKQDQPEGH
jgi:hypothetical protein